MDDLISKAIDLACFHLNTNNLKEAELVLDQILKIEDNLIAKYLLAACHGEIIDFEESQDSNFLNNLGIIFIKAKLYDEATELFFRSIILDKKNSHAWSNLAGCYKRKNMFWTASKLLLKSLSIKEDKQMLINLAQVYAELRMIKEAKECLEKALEIDKECVAAQVDLASALFLMGDWELPAKLYRKRYKHFASLKKILEVFPEEKMWNGENIENKKIIVFSEQGKGDTFNFIRFAKVLGARFPNNDVSVSVSVDLEEFFQNQGYKINKEKEYDLCCSMMDLPWLLNLSKKDVIIKEPFKTTKKFDFSYFKDKFKIGICWAGNPVNPRDQHRSCELKLFKQIHELPSVKLFSLQHDLRPRIWQERKDPVNLSEGCSDMKIVNMQPYMKSWDDTAAIISGLDLVISVDTSVMHLAAGLNKTTFGLIAYLPDWRWGLEGENIWYPSLKLFRQKEIDDWEGILDKVKEEVEILVKNSHIY